MDSAADSGRGSPERMTGRISVVGLGPGGWEAVPDETKTVLLDPVRRVFVRTLSHPAARSLARRRNVESGDEIYESAESFEDVYEALADLIVRAALEGDDVVLALPGSPLVGERTTRLIMEKAERAAIPCAVVSAQSFLDAVWRHLALDPLERGFQILDGRNLPDPISLDVPTIIAQIDVAVVVADVAGLLDRVLPNGSEVTVLRELGSPEATAETVPVSELGGVAAGPRTAIFVDAPGHGWAGLVQTMRRLRRDCPWDAHQTHVSLASHLVEETYELLEAIASLPEDSAEISGAFADLEEELGDVLLQVLFQSVIASEEGAFDIGDVVEVLRRKLVRRHPHVFGEAEAGTAKEVYARWESIKAAERPSAPSVLDGVPVGLPALQRAEAVQRKAAAVGFDWQDLEGVLAKVSEELEELRDAGPRDGELEIGDLLFAAVNAARHLNADPEQALRKAVRRFEERFRSMEARADLAQASLEEMDRIWQEVKLDPDA